MDIIINYLERNRNKKRYGNKKKKRELLMNYKMILFVCDLSCDSMDNWIQIFHIISRYIHKTHRGIEEEKKTHKTLIKFYKLINYWFLNVDNKP